MYVDGESQVGETVTVDGVMVANAALAEVGLPETARRLPTGHLFVDVPAKSPSAYRAALLGWIADQGSDLILVRCLDCSWGHALPPYPEPCTPARDALRGITCGRPS